MEAYLGFFLATLIDCATEILQLMLFSNGRGECKIEAAKGRESIKMHKKKI